MSFLIFCLDMSNDEVLKEVINGYHMSKPESCTSELYGIMLECWHKNPSSRPSFQTLKSKLDDFFTMDSSHYDEV